MIYARLGDGKSEGYFRSYWNSYTMKHEENEKLDRIYALLVKLGYEMSDDEKALQDGTHELFGRRPANEASTCKGCGAATVWIRTPGGKSMPCDATPRYYIEKPRSGSKKIVTPNGEVISCEYTERSSTRPPAPASLPTGGAAGRRAISRGKAKWQLRIIPAA